MHVIGIALVAIVVAGYVVWRLRSAHKAAQQVVGAAHDARLYVRRGLWGWRVRERPLGNVDTPLLAATCVLILAMRCERDITTEDRSRLADEMERTFRVDRTEAESLISQALFAVRDVTDEATWAGRLAKVIARGTTEEERAQVLDAMNALAGNDGLSHRQRQVAERYTLAAGLQSQTP